MNWFWSDSFRNEIFSIVSIMKTNTETRCGTRIKSYRNETRSSIESLKHQLINYEQNIYAGIPVSHSSCNLMTLKWALNVKMLSFFLFKIEIKGLLASFLVLIRGLKGVRQWRQCHFSKINAKMAET